jgi:hypothetical protein
MDGAADEFLVGERPVDLGGVEEGDVQDPASSLPAPV